MREEKLIFKTRYFSYCEINPIGHNSYKEIRLQPTAWQKYNLITIDDVCQLDSVSVRNVSLMLQCFLHQKSADVMIHFLCRTELDLYLYLIKLHFYDSASLTAAPTQPPPRPPVNAYIL